MPSRACRRLSCAVRLGVPLLIKCGRFPEVFSFAAGMACYDTGSARFYFIAQKAGERTTHFITTLDVIDAVG